MDEGDKPFKPAEVTLRGNPELFARFLPVLSLFAETIGIKESYLYSRMGFNTVRTQASGCHIGDKKIFVTLTILPAKTTPYPDDAIVTNIHPQLSDSERALFSDYLEKYIYRMRAFYLGFVTNYAYLFERELMARQNELAPLLMELKIDEHFRAYLNPDGRRLYINVSFLN